MHISLWQPGRALSEAVLDLTQLSFKCGVCPPIPSAPDKKWSEGVGGMGLLVAGQTGPLPDLWLWGPLGGCPVKAALRIMRAIYGSATDQLRDPD